jgi:hypothetical protein
MNRRIFYIAALLLTLLAASESAAQVVLTRRCPGDQLPTKADGGITFTGTSARQYIEAFLSGDPNGDSRVATNTTSLNASMITILTDAVEADRGACTRLNSFLSSGASAYPSPPWVYFRGRQLLLRYEVDRSTRFRRTVPHLLRHRHGV